MDILPRNWKLGILCAIIAALLLLSYHYWKVAWNESTPRRLKTGSAQIPDAWLTAKDGERHKKWIVVTTISQPTKQIRKLSQIPGWKLVVVADAKTPLNWKLSNVILLDINSQKKLGHNVCKMLPWNPSTRKIIGYLYAIQNGAQFIYDTDDDTAPNDPLSFENNFVFEKITRGLVTGSSNVVENPYAHFGQRAVWPRGFPLDRISYPPNKTYITCPMHTPIVQQGLVNGDPDVDTIFRTTKRFLKKRLNIEFDRHAPPMIFPQSVLAPFNSKNTMFHYKAFWSLVLPISVTFRVTDIWRAYWTQPLLWKIGGHLGFYPPKTTQDRNSHVYLRNFGEDAQLFTQSGVLTHFLSNWKCPNSTLYNCMLSLTEAMAHKGFWSFREMDLMRAWISDLQATGYQEPALKARSSPCLTNQVRSLALFNAVDKSVGEYIHRTELREFCNFTSAVAVNSPSPKFPTDLLVVIFNFPHYENIWLLDLVYRPHYPNILYCGEMGNWSILSNLLTSKEFIAAGVKDISFVKTINIDNGYLLYECALRAIDMNYGVSGYLFIADDILLNFWNNWKLNPAQMWIENNIFYRQENLSLAMQPTSSFWTNWWNTAYQPALDALPLLYHSSNPLVQKFWRRREKLRTGNGSWSRIGFTMSDMFYVPAARQEMYYAVGSILWKAKIFVEISTLLLSEGISGPRKIGRLNGTSLWDGDRNEPFKSFRPSQFFLHPVKLSSILTGNAAFRRNYCDQYILRVLGTHEEIKYYVN